MRRIELSILTRITSLNHYCKQQCFSSYAHHTATMTTRSTDIHHSAACRVTASSACEVTHTVGFLLLTIVTCARRLVTQHYMMRDGIQQFVASEHGMYAKQTLHVARGGHLIIVMHGTFVASHAMIRLLLCYKIYLRRRAIAHLIR